MLKGLFSGKIPEQVLPYLENYEEGYGKAIADTFEISLSSGQKQLQKFEDSGLLVSRLVGKTRLYTWSPRSPFVDPVRNLLAQRLKSHHPKKSKPTNVNAADLAKPINPLEIDKTSSLAEITTIVSTTLTKANIEVFILP